MNLFNYLFDLFLSFSHLLVKKLISKEDFEVIWNPGPPKTKWHWRDSNLGPFNLETTALPFRYGSCNLVPILVEIYIKRFP